MTRTPQRRATDLLALASPPLHKRKLPWWPAWLPLTLALVAWVVIKAAPL